MDLIKKLDECERRFKEVSDLVMDPNLVKDPKTQTACIFVSGNTIREY